MGKIPDNDERIIFVADRELWVGFEHVEQGTYIVYMLRILVPFMEDKIVTW